jgi:hypothetical protein
MRKKDVLAKINKALEIQYSQLMEITIHDLNNEEVYGPTDKIKVIEKWDYDYCMNAVDISSRIKALKDLREEIKNLK